MAELLLELYSEEIPPQLQIAARSQLKQFIENFFKEDKIIIESIINKVPELKKLIDKQELNQYMKEVINFSFSANKYFNDLKPWDLKKVNICLLYTSPSPRD